MSLSTSTARSRARQGRPQLWRQRHELHERQKRKRHREQDRHARVPCRDELGAAPERCEQERNCKQLQDGVGDEACPRSAAEQNAGDDDESGQPK